MLRVLLVLPHACMMPNEQQMPPWLGFVVGLLGGFAVSALLIGLVLGYSVAGSMPSIPGQPQVANQPKAPTPPAAPEAAPAPAAVPEITAKDHVRGPKNAKITIVEYSDYECPFCKRHHPTIQQVMKEYPNDVNWVYRHFPLSFHQYAQKAAEASECVAELGGNDAFWKFTDAVLADADAPTPAVLEKAAGAAGVNAAKFKTCLDSGKHAQIVSDHMQGGISAGVQGTPGNFIINNSTKEKQEISGAVPFASFKTAIDGMLGK